MGLPRYIINYEESMPYIEGAIREGKIKVGLDIKINQETQAILDTTIIETKTNELEILNKDVNKKFSDIRNEISEIVKSIIDTKTQKEEKFNEVQNFLKKVLENEELISKDLEDIINQISPIGEQRVKGFYRYVPPVRGDFVISFKESSDILLTAITFSQIGWKFEDTFSLNINGKYNIINNVSTKEVAEKKKFVRKERVPANTPINFVLHNNSGNSRQMWLDIEYVIPT
jgi:hypothetical protein